MSDQAIAEVDPSLISRTLVVAQEAAQKLLAEAQLEHDQIVSTAKAQATRESEAQLASLDNAISAKKAELMQLDQELHDKQEQLARELQGDIELVSRLKEHVAAVERALNERAWGQPAAVDDIAEWTSLSHEDQEPLSVGEDSATVSEGSDSVDDSTAYQVPATFEEVTVNEDTAVQDGDEARDPFAFWSNVSETEPLPVDKDGAEELRAQMVREIPVDVMIDVDPILGVSGMRVPGAGGIVNPVPVDVPTFGQDETDATVQFHWDS